MHFKRTIGWWAAGLFLASAPAADATTVTQMNLADLAGRAGRIFRGTVVAVDEGTVAAGGGEVPTVIYRLRVTDALKGAYVTEGARRFAEVRMVGRVKHDDTVGKPRRVSPLGALPALEMGREYLLFTTTPSRVGLSTTVGLGQGAFRILGEGEEAAAVNAFANAGLFDRMADPRASRLSGAGPVPYADLASSIRALVGRE